MYRNSNHLSFSIRGKLGTLTTTARNFGVLMIFSVGAAVDYQYIPIIFVSLPILYLVCFMSLPNTPQFYLEKEQVQVKQLSELNLSELTH